MKNREGADASQAGTSGGRGKWLPRGHHCPLAPAARPIRAGGCSGCVTSGDPFPLPEGPEIADGRDGTAGRGQTPRGQLGEQFDPGPLGALEAGALGQLPAAAASFRDTVGPGDRPEPSTCPPPCRFAASTKAASVLPVALPALGNRQTPSTCRPVVLLASGIGSNADVLPVVPLPCHSASVVGRALRRSKVAVMRPPVAGVPPVVSPAPSPGKRC